MLDGHHGVARSRARHPSSLPACSACPASQRRQRQPGAGAPGAPRRRKPPGALERGAAAAYALRSRARAPACSSAADAGVVGADRGGREMPGAAVDISIGKRPGQRRCASRRSAPARRRRSPTARAGGGTRRRPRRSDTSPALSAAPAPTGRCPARAAARASTPSSPRVARRRQHQRAPRAARRAAAARFRNARVIRAETSTGAPSEATRARRRRRPARAAPAGCRRSPRAAAAPPPAPAPSSSSAASSLLSPPTRSIGRSAPSSSGRLVLAGGDQHRDRVGEQPAEREQQRLRARTHPASGRRRSAPRPAPARRTRRAGSASPRRRRIDPAPAPGAAPTRLRARSPAGAGIRSSIASAGRSSSSSQANGICASDSTPRARRSRMPSACCGGVIEQRRLADPRLADERERGAGARSRPRQSVLDLVALLLTPEQHRREFRSPGAGGQRARED